MNSFGEGNNSTISNNMAQFSFDQIKSSYEQAKKDGRYYAQGSLADFAGHMQGLDQKNDWSQGQLPDNALGSFSRGVDKAFEWTGLPAVTSDVGGGLGSLVDFARGENDQKYEQLGQKFGKDIPRQAAGVGLAVGGLAMAPFSGGTSTAATAAGLTMLGLGAADTGIKAYADTGSATAGGLAAATNLFAPGVAGVGSKAGLSVLAKAAPSLTESTIARFVASEIGSESAFFLTQAAQTAAQGENPFTGEAMFGQALGTLAFSPLSVYHGVKNARVEKPHTVSDERPNNVTTGEELFGVQVPSGLNAEHKLFDYLTGKQDKAITEAFIGNNEREALRLSGALDPDLFEWAPRREGREAFKQATETDDAAARDRLIQKASVLLAEPATTLDEFVGIVAATNKFQSKVEAQKTAEFRRVAKAADQTGDVVLQNAQRGVAEQQPTNNGLLIGWNPERYPEDIRSAFDTLENRRRLEWENEQRRVGMVGETVPDLPELEFQSPPLNSPARARWEIEQQGGKYTEPTGARPERVRGRVNPNKLANEISRPARASKIEENPIFDKNGKITTPTLEKRFDDFIRRGDTPEEAIRRVDQIVRGALASKVADSEGVPQSLLRITDEALVANGVTPEERPFWLKATANALAKLDIPETTKPLSWSDMERVGLASPDERQLGTYWDTIGYLGVSNKPRNSEAPTAAYNMVVTTAHESIHAVVDAAKQAKLNGTPTKTSKLYDDSIAFLDTVSPRERLELMRRIQRMVIPRDLRVEDALRADELDGVLRSASETSDEAFTQIGAMLSVSVVKDKAEVARIHSSLKWLPEPLQRFAQTLFRTMDEIRSALTASVRYLGWDDGRVQELNKFHDNMEKLLSEDVEYTKMKETVMGSVKPMDVLVNDPAQVMVRHSTTGSKVVDERSAEISKMGWLERNVGSLVQQANSLKYKTAIPEFSRVMGLLTGLTGRIHTMNNAMRTKLLVSVDGGRLQELSKISDSKLSPDQIALKTNWGKVANNVDLKKSLSKIYLKVNEMAGDNSVEVPTWDSPAIKAIWSKHSEADQSAMKAVYDSQLEGNREAASQILHTMYRSVGWDVAKMYKASGLSHADAEKSANIFMDHMLRNQQLPVEIRGLDGTEQVTRFWEKVRPELDELKVRLDRPYFSELRTGRYSIVFDTGDPTNPGRAPANSARERDAVIKQLEKEGKKVTQVEDNKNPTFGDLDSVPSYVAERLLRIEQVRLDEALDAIDPVAAQSIRENFILGQGVREQVDRKNQFMARRRLAPGREMIDMVNNQAAYLQMVAAKMSKRQVHDEASWRMQSENWNKDARLRSEVEEFTKNILSARSPHPWLSNFSKAVIGTTYGGNISSAIVDSTQPLMVGVARLAETIGNRKAFKYITEGYTKAFGLGKTDPEYAKVLERLAGDNVLYSGYTADEFLGLSDVIGFNMAHGSDNKSLVDAKELLTNRVYMAGKTMDAFKQYADVAYKGAMIPTRFSTQLTNKVTAYATWKSLKDRGITGDAAYAEVKRMVELVNFQGGQAAQSAFKQKFGKMNGIAQAATLLTNYPISVASHMVSNYKSMLRSSGLDAATRQKAAKIFAGQVVTQFAMAGSLGFGLGALFKLSEQMFGINPEEEIRKNLQAVDESGTFADILLHGVANKFTGLDLAGRFDLGGIGGFNSYTGFEAKGMFGAAGTFWSNVASLPTDIREGGLTENKLLPSVIRNSIEALQQGPITDKNGQVLIEPSTTERIAQFVGFRPERLASIQRQRSLYRSIDTLEQNANRVHVGKMIDMLDKGDFNGALTALKEEVDKEIQLNYSQLDPYAQKQQADKLLRSRALELVNATVQKTTPLDPMSQGDARTSGRRRELAATFGTNIAARSSQVEAQQKQAQLLTGLGLSAVRRTPRSLQIMQLVDQITSADPTIPLQQARALAEQQLSGR